MELVLQQLVNGLGLTGPILLVAVALSSGIAAARLVNVAVGAIYVLTSFLGVKLLVDGPSWILVLFLILAPVAMMLVLEFTAFRWQRQRARSAEEVEQSSFALTAAIATVLTALAGQLTAGQPVALPSGKLDIETVWAVGGIRIQVEAVAIFVVAAVAALGWAVILRRTRIGKLFRATAEDLSLARSSGIRVQNVALTGVLTTGLLLGIASCLSLIRVRTVDTESAVTFLLLPFAAVLIAGIGEVAGAVIASLVFGLIYSLVAVVAPNPAYQDVAVFLLLFLVLLVRPQGLSFKQARDQRASSQPKPSAKVPA